jgi:hypothetical protein
MEFFWSLVTGAWEFFIEIKHAWIWFVPAAIFFFACAFFASQSGATSIVVICSLIGIACIGISVIAYRNDGI